MDGKRDTEKTNERKEDRMKDETYPVKHKLLYEKKLSAKQQRQPSQRDSIPSSLTSTYNISSSNNLYIQASIVHKDQNNIQPLIQSQR